VAAPGHGRRARAARRVAQPAAAPVPSLGTAPNHIHAPPPAPRRCVDIAIPSIELPKPEMPLVLTENTGLARTPLPSFVVRGAARREGARHAALGPLRSVR
jgi:hypothetical protein